MNDQAHINFMKEAIRISIENVDSGDGGPFGALVVREGQIIARGRNLVTGTNDPTAHAEVVAIRNACRAINSFQLQGCYIYSSCEPCPMCLGAIYWARPEKLFFAAGKTDAAEYGFDDHFIYDELSKPFNERLIEATQMLREHAIGAFIKWKESEFYKPY